MMKSIVLLLLSTLMVVAQVPSPTGPQEVDGSELQREVRERQERISKLSVEDQLKMRAAQQKAVEDPVVKAALEKRNQAIMEFRAALQASMIQSDPSLAPILEKVGRGGVRGF